MTAPDAEAIALAAATEINELRERVVTLTGHSVTLNSVCWFLATELGLVQPGQTTIMMAPMELARQIVAQRDRFRDLAMRNQAGSADVQSI